MHYDLSFTPSRSRRARTGGDRPPKARSPHGSSTGAARPKPSDPSDLLAEVIERYHRHLASSHDAGRGPPHLRLKDWRVVEEVTVAGTSYVLLRRVAASSNAFATLSARERDAAILASTGISNKEIAHQMGITGSTVGVLLSRASRKLGAADRRDLIRIVRRERADPSAKVPPT
jgi:DNA-binding CsgD family transcriptional regulator